EQLPRLVRAQGAEQRGHGRRRLGAFDLAELPSELILDLQERVADPVVHQLLGLRAELRAEHLAERLVLDLEKGLTFDPEEGVADSGPERRWQELHERIADDGHERIVFDLQERIAGRVFERVAELLREERGEVLVERTAEVLDDARSEFVERVDRVLEER